MEIKMVFAENIKNQKDSKSTGNVMTRTIYFTGSKALIMNINRIVEKYSGKYHSFETKEFDALIMAKINEVDKLEVLSNKLSDSYKEHNQRIYAYILTEIIKLIEEVLLILDNQRKRLGRYLAEVNEDAKILTQYIVATKNCQYCKDSEEVTVLYNVKRFQELAIAHIIEGNNLEESYAKYEKEIKKYLEITRSKLHK